MTQSSCSFAAVGVADCIRAVEAFAAPPASFANHAAVPVAGAAGIAVVEACAPVAAASPAPGGIPLAASPVRPLAVGAAVAAGELAVVVATSSRFAFRSRSMGWEWLSGKLLPWLRRPSLPPLASARPPAVGPHLIDAVQSFDVVELFALG